MRWFAIVLALPTVATAQPITEPRGAMAVEGDVVATHSRWTADGSRIVTEAIVRTPAGEVTVSQLGGRVGGLAMRSFPGPSLLVPGMRVAVTAHRDVDLAARTHVVVDGVRVLAMPPGYVRTGPTEAGNYLHWESGCVLVTADAAGTKQLPGDSELDLIQEAIATWNTGAAGCSYMEIRYQGTADVEVGRDAINVIKFRDGSWCRPAVGDDPPRCHPPEAAGITTAVYVDDPDSDRDGAIVDADIELNGKDFSISNMGVTLGTAPCRAELLNTLTHELGHLLGIEHPCRAAGDPPRVDDEGQPVPSCSQIMGNQEITESTMFNIQDCDETKKATLEPEDIAAVCGIYPLADDPGECEAVDLTPGGCCGASNEPAGAVLAGGVWAIVAGRRRRRRGKTSSTNERSGILFP